MVFIDLEDSVLASDKAGAREQAIYALNNMIWGQKTRAVRVKDVRSQYGYTDVVKVAEGAGQSLDLLVILKVRSVADVTVCRYVTRRHRGAL
jgi:citrate lyase subunit beta/citryl-CoA lyase